jgi:putative ABC transport system permease protein
VTFSDILGDVRAVEGAMSNINFFAELIIWFSVIATVLILSLFLILSIQDRKHEIGIYLSVGEKKVNIIIQILLETLTPVLAGISIALFIGNFLADFISRNLIMQELQSSQMQHNQNGFFFNNGFYSMFLDNHIATAISSYEVSLTGDQIVLFYAMGIGIAILSVGIALVYFLRLSPKAILLKQ